MNSDGESTQENLQDLYLRKDYLEDISNMEYLLIWLGTTPNNFFHLLIMDIMMIMDTEMKVMDTGMKVTDMEMKVTDILMQTINMKNQIKVMVTILTESKMLTFLFLLFKLISQYLKTLFHLIYIY